MQGASPLPEHLLDRDVLQRERILNAHRINLVRAAATSFFLCLTFIAPLIDDARFLALTLRIDIAWWILSLALCVFARYSPRIARLSTYCIGLLDIPALFLKNRIVISAFSAHPGLPVQPDFAQLHGVLWLAMTSLLPCLYAILLCFTLLSLRRLQVACTGTFCILSVAQLQTRLGLPTRLIIMTAVFLFIATGLATYATSRTLTLVAEVARAQARRARLRRYLSPSVAEMIESSNADGFPGELRTVTVLFSDIRGFTSMAERLEPIAVIGLLNVYHTAMADIVFAHGGTLDKFIGDGLMAYFGAPLPQPDHAARAVACALAMQARLSIMNAQRQKQSLPALRIGIGLHSGPVVLGDIGSPQQHDCTIVGDTVNVASRMEQLTKSRDLPILLSRQTRDLAGSAFTFLDAGENSVTGRVASIHLFTPVHP